MHVQSVGDEEGNASFSRTQSLEAEGEGVNEPTHLAESSPSVAEMAVCWEMAFSISVFVLVKDPVSTHSHIQL